MACRKGSSSPPIYFRPLLKLPAAFSEQRVSHGEKVSEGPGWTMYNVWYSDSHSVYESKGHVNQQHSTSHQTSSGGGNSQTRFNLISSNRPESDNKTNSYIYIQIEIHIQFSNLPWICLGESAFYTWEWGRKKKKRRT
jgi:hypothetical protein